MGVVVGHSGGLCQLSHHKPVGAVEENGERYKARNRGLLRSLVCEAVLTAVSEIVAQFDCWVRKCATSTRVGIPGRWGSLARRIVEWLRGSLDVMRSNTEDRLRLIRLRHTRRFVLSESD